MPGYISYSSIDEKLQKYWKNPENSEEYYVTPRLSGEGKKAF